MGKRTLVLSCCVRMWREQSTSWLIIRLRLTVKKVRGRGGGGFVSGGGWKGKKFYYTYFLTFFNKTLTFHSRAYVFSPSFGSFVVDFPPVLVSTFEWGFFRLPLLTNERRFDS